MRTEKLSQAGRMSWWSQNNNELPAGNQSVFQKTMRIVLLFIG